MTCYSCQYEFCWGCGGGAGPGENHFNGNGCGVDMMDYSIKPGDGVYREDDGMGFVCCKPGCKYAFKWIGIAFLAVIAFPIYLVFALPLAIADYFSASARDDERYVMAIFLGLLGFLLGLCLNSCFIPLAILAAIGFFFYAIFMALKWLIDGCNHPDNGDAATR